MKRIAKHIMVFLLSLIFLVSFSGIRLMMHHCFSCETTDITFLGFASEDARSMHQKHREASSCHLPAHGKETHTCCDSHAHDDAECKDCCESEVHYLKTDYKVSHEKSEIRVAPLELTVLIPVLYPSEDAGLLTAKEYRFYPDRAPPRPAGRDFIIYSHQLKIA